MRRTAAALLAALVLSACGGGGDDTAVDAGSTTSSSTTTSSTTAPSTTTTAPGDLPGEVIEIFPYEGAELAVVGVAADDVLNVRTGPGTDYDVAFELDPLATGVVATGHNRAIDRSAIWAEVTSDAGTGWANVQYLSHLGQTTEITREVAPTPGDLPLADTLLQLGQLVADARASEEPRSTITVVDGPSVGDLGEITVDVLGLGDDSVGGERLRVFGTPDPGGESFRLRTVEATLLCTRGVSDGLCV